MKRQKPRYAPLGTVSHATLRTEDLIPAFLDTLSGLRLTGPDRLTFNAARREWNRCETNSDEFRRPCKAHGPDPIETEDGCAEQLSELLNETLFQLLENYAPPFCYFGSTEGDGSDFGFWLSRDALDEALYTGEVWNDIGNGSKAPKSCAFRLVVSDHGNMTLYTRNGREVWGIV